MIQNIKNIEIQNRNIEYTLRVSKRARHVRLSVYSGGDFVVTVPRNAPQGIVERFIYEKSRWIIDRIDYFKQFPKQVFGIGQKSKKERAAAYVAHKEAARDLAHDRLAHFNRFYGFTYHKVAIRNQKTRWGSCSRHGNLNFNYKIALLTPRQADYIIVHELCHLGEFNHSRDFWALVERTVPDYLAIQEEIKRAAISLR